jgi:hypothetical protein
MRTPSRLLFGLACLAVAACSSESPATGGLHVALNSDGADPHLATLTAESRTAWLYGSKDADGAPAGVDAIVVDDVPGGRTITVTVDAYGRPLSVGDTTGRVATFAYTDFAAVVTFKGGKAECQKLLGTASTVFTHAGTGLAAIALACALATGPGTPFCVPLLSWQGAFLGLGVAAAGSVSTIGAAKCDDLAIPPDPQQMTVSLTASQLPPAERVA